MGRCFSRVGTGVSFASGISWATAESGTNSVPRAASRIALIMKTTLFVWIELRLQHRGVCDRMKSCSTKRCMTKHLLVGPTLLLSGAGRGVRRNGAVPEGLGGRDALADVV